MLLPLLISAIIGGVSGGLLEIYFIVVAALFRELLGLFLLTGITCCECLVLLSL